MFPSLYLPMLSEFLLSSLLMFTIFPVYAQQQPQCHGDELSALLQFKDSFVMDRFASSSPSAYSKVASWKIEGESRECCLWDGVECDHDTGHVIGLSLNSSFLYGFINSSNSLFDLVHLEKLNLADNDFNYSRIPPTIGRLSRLSYLDLSQSLFSGQIPSELLGLSKLTHLDLSKNGWYDVWGYSVSFLLLEKPSLEDLVQSLPNLKVLDLAFVNTSSSSLVPRALSNMSSLTRLGLESCGLSGEFPNDIFNLPNLQSLSVTNNRNLTGYFPEFNSSSPLQELTFQATGFSGVFPDSIGNLKALTVLKVSGSPFWGKLPSSMANLTRLTWVSLIRNDFDVGGNLPFPIGLLSELILLELDHIGIQGHIPESLSNLTHLTYLNLGNNALFGEIPPSIGNITQLVHLELRNNALIGEIPPSIGNLAQLLYLDLFRNQLEGTIPSSITQLRHLQVLCLSSKNSSGRVDLDLLLTMLPDLYLLQLSEIKVTGLTKNSKNSTVAQLQVLGLSSCNLRKFPELLKFQNQLMALYLDGNKIEGEIPIWLWNTTKESLRSLNLEHNFLTGFEKHPDSIPWRSLEFIHLSFNMLQGAVPIPPPSTIVYFLIGNYLSGEIPDSICYNTSLRTLDLSHNNLSGSVPQCLLNSIGSLAELNLRGNNLGGSIPKILGTKTNLTMIDLSGNQLTGRLPRSLANCISLKALVLGSNHIEDTFPFWLGNLSDLEVLVLRSNKFYGTMEDPPADTYSWYPKLRIIDLSHNAFHGVLCSKCIDSWSSMKKINVTSSLYLIGNRVIDRYGLKREGVQTYDYSVTLVVKGTQRFYQRMPNALVVMDLSNNNFQGEIPESVASLVGLQVLNIYNNNLSGVIPTSLENLTRMESLDLSQNHLSGEIPQQLNQLTFLAVLNLSGNHLTGPIPRGKQFDTFDNSSYGGNPGLCGLPLSKLCADPDALPPPPSSFYDNEGSDDESKFPATFVDWIVISVGYAGGITVGLIVGHMLTTRYHEWFMYKFGRAKKTRRNHRRAGLRN